jgi:hypothetical protein
MTYIIFALIAGFILGVVARKPKIQHVYDTESETIARVVDELKANIKRREERLLGDRCGWSEGDRLRDRNSYDRSVLKLFGEPYGD